MSKTPKRPAGVHPKAWFDAGDNEWVFGPLVDGKKHGDFTFWRPDGTKCNECHFVHDVAHGAFKRFHENGEVSQDGAFEKGKLQGTRRWFSTDSKTTENTRPAGVSERVWRSEMDYVQDRVVGIRHFNREGERVLPRNGEPYPVKPDGVDEGAEYVEPKDEWHKGSSDGNTQKKVGRWRVWSREGKLKHDVHYEADQLHGAARFEFAANRSPFADGSVVAERGEYVHGERSGKWEGLDAAGKVKVTFDYGKVDGLEVQRRVEFANGSHDWAKLAALKEAGGHLAEALFLHARAAATSGDLAPFKALLAKAARPVTDDAGVALAMELDEPFHRLAHEVLNGANAALALNKVGIALDQAFQSRAALDFTNVAIALDPERSEFLFTRSLILMSLGLKAQAERDANDLAADSPDRAEFLLAYLSGLFPSWSFTPDHEAVSTTFEEVPEAPARSLEEVQALSQKYATRLTALRTRLLEKLTPANPALPPDLSNFIPEGPVELEVGNYDVKDGDGERQTIEFNEQLSLDEADLPSLLRLARADWVALSWLCWASGAKSVAPLTQFEPPADFGKAAGMAQQRLWRARDQRAFKGRNAAAHGVPGFEWEGNDVADLPPPVAGIAEDQYAEMQALFLWLTNENLRSPWQDDLRGS